MAPTPGGVGHADFAHGVSFCQNRPSLQVRAVLRILQRVSPSPQQRGVPSASVCPRSPFGPTPYPMPCPVKVPVHSASHGIGCAGFSSCPVTDRAGLAPGAEHRPQTSDPSRMEYLFPLNEAEYPEVFALFDGTGAGVASAYKIGNRLLNRRFVNHANFLFGVTPALDAPPLNETPWTMAPLQPLGHHVQDGGAPPPSDSTERDQPSYLRSNSTVASAMRALELDMDPQAINSPKCCAPASTPAPSDPEGEMDTQPLSPKGRLSLENDVLDLGDMDVSCSPAPAQITPLDSTVASTAQRRGCCRMFIIPLPKTHSMDRGGLPESWQSIVCARACGACRLTQQFRHLQGLLLGVPFTRMDGRIDHNQDSANAIGAHTYNRNTSAMDFDLGSLHLTQLPSPTHLCHVKNVRFLKLSEGHRPETCAVQTWAFWTGSAHQSEQHSKVPAKTTETPLKWTLRFQTHINRQTRIPSSSVCCSRHVDMALFPRAPPPPQASRTQPCAARARVPCSEKFRVQAQEFGVPISLMLFSVGVIVYRAKDPRIQGPWISAEKGI